jgi:histidinol-phosphate aminotransferase
MNIQRLEEVPVIGLGYEQVKSEVVRLHLGENHYPFNKDIVANVIDNFDEDFIKDYPEQNAFRLQQAIKSAFNLPNKLSMIFGNGSSDLINCLFQLFCLPRGSVLTVNPDFFLYKRLTRIYTADFHTVDFQGSLEKTIDKLILKANRINPSMLILSNPNNPLACCYDLALIEKLVSNVKCPVVIDEAYFAYAKQSSAVLIDKYPNLMVIQTLSKLGFAGLRLGYIMASGQLLTAIKKIVLPFNVNKLTLEMAQKLLEDRYAIKTRIRQTINEREKVLAWIKQSQEYTCHKSHTNFINLKPLNYSAKLVHEYLLKHGIKTVYVDMPGIIENSLRISIDTPEHNQRLLECLVFFNY